MKEFKKNLNVVKLEPKPVKMPKRLLDLKKGKKNSSFDKLRMTGREEEKKQDNRGNLASRFRENDRRESGNDNKNDNKDSISWVVQEGGGGKEMTFAGKLFIFLMLLVAVIGFIMDSPMMVLTFLLFAIVFYFFLKREKENVKINIRFNGVKVGETLYTFDNLKSFWVFYDPPYEKYLSIGTKSSFTPFVRIKLNEQDPVEIRNFLIEYLSEEEHPSPFMEIMMERLGL